MEREGVLSPDKANNSKKRKSSKSSETCSFEKLPHEWKKQLLLAFKDYAHMKEQKWNYVKDDLKYTLFEETDGRFLSLQHTWLVRKGYDIVDGELVCNGIAVPSTDGSFAIPSTAGSFAVPSTAGSFAVPSTAGSFAVPSTAGSFAVPSTAGSFAAPSSDGSFGRTAKKLYSGISLKGDSQSLCKKGTDGESSSQGSGKNMKYPKNNEVLTEELLIKLLNGYLDTHQKEIVKSVETEFSTHQKEIVKSVETEFGTHKKEIVKSVETEFSKVKKGIALVVKDLFNRRGGGGFGSDDRSGGGDRGGDGGGSGHFSRECPKGGGN